MTRVGAACGRPPGDSPDLRGLAGEQSSPLHRHLRQRGFRIAEGLNFQPIQA